MQLTNSLYVSNKGYLKQLLTKLINREISAATNKQIIVIIFYFIFVAVMGLLEVKVCQKFETKDFYSICLMDFLIYYQGKPSKDYLPKELS